MYNIVDICIVSENTCQFELRNKSGVIHSPDMDSDGAYDFNLHCTWSIRVHPNMTIQYQFLFLSLRSWMETVDSLITFCDGDYVTVGLEILNESNENICLFVLDTIQYK